MGLAFDFIATTTDTRIAMPANNHSPIYLVTTGRNNVEITLPAPASATSRFIVIQRVDRGRKVVVRPLNNEPIDGARQPMVMDDKYDAITLVTDGQQWVVLYRRQ